MGGALIMGRGYEILHVKEKMYLGSGTNVYCYHVTKPLFVVFISSVRCKTLPLVAMNI